MLIINRNIGEKLVFTDTVTGTVIRVEVRKMKGRSVNFCIDAPNHIRVERPERNNDAGNQQAVADSNVRAETTRFDEGIGDDEQGTTTL